MARATEVLPLTAQGAEPGDAIARRAAELLRAHQHEIYARTDRMFAYLMGVQWITGIVFALLVSPRTWSGTVSRTNTHVWAAVVLGGILSVCPAILALVRAGEASTRYIVATAQMLMSALLIHLSGGRLETHFHVFGSLAFLAFYRDWRVLVPATIVVAADHALRGLFWPESVYGVLVASPWRWVEHAAWVLFEDVFLVISCVRGTQDVMDVATRTAVLEHANREVEAATRAKSHFLANMSHELRTPLNAITLYSELLEEDAVAAGRSTDADDLGKIQKASKHLLRLINDILDLSKIEAGKMDVHVESFEIRPMIAELTGTLDPILRQNGNHLTVSIGDDVAFMHADLVKTRQILFNLLSNAAKFTKDGRITLRIDLMGSGAAPFVRFVVADTGIGMTDEQRGRLFRPFAQGDSSVSRKYGGTGLGLALVWRFCQLMGGSVTATSAMGEGSTFTVLLPATVVPVEGVAA